jgi:hypothetical protein
MKGKGRNKANDAFVHALGNGYEIRIAKRESIDEPIQPTTEPLNHARIPECIQRPTVDATPYRGSHSKTRWVFAEQVRSSADVPVRQITRG